MKIFEQYTKLVDEYDTTLRRLQTIEAQLAASVEAMEQEVARQFKVQKTMRVAGGYCSVSPVQKHFVQSGGRYPECLYCKRTVI